MEDSNERRKSIFMKRPVLNNVEEAFDSIQLKDPKKTNLKIRFTHLLHEYSKRKTRYSIAFYTLRTSISVGSLIVPALLSVQYSTPFGNEIYWTVWILSLLVTMSNAIITLYKIDKKFYTLHTTYHYLMSEGWQYVNLSGNYYTPDANHENQFPSFSHKIEKIKMKHVEEEYFKVLASGEQQNQEILTPASSNYRFSTRRKSISELNGQAGQLSTPTSATVYPAPSPFIQIQRIPSSSDTKKTTFASLPPIDERKSSGSGSESGSETFPV
jgi:hypothetical protein